MSDLSKVIADAHNIKDYQKSLTEYLEALLYVCKIETKDQIHKNDTNNGKTFYTTDYDSIVEGIQRCLKVILNPDSWSKKYEAERTLKELKKELNKLEN